MGPEKELSDVQKLQRLLQYWVHHNEQHILDHEKWKRKAEVSGLTGVAEELAKVVALSKEANSHMERAQKLLEDEERAAVPAKAGKAEDQDRASQEPKAQDYGEYRVKPIGVIRTPYVDSAPYQPLANDGGVFRLCLDPAYAEGVKDLERFRYIYVLYFIHRISKKPSMTVTPPWASGKKVGLFASRSPARPNPLGLSIVQVKRVRGNEIFTSGLDAFDGTPLLDIKPYIRDLDSKEDANYGWLEDLEDRDHLMLHIKGIPHDY